MEIGLRFRFLLLSLVFLMPIVAIGKGRLERIPMVSPVLSGYTDVDSVEHRIMDSGPERVEGIWKFEADGSTIAIERDGNGSGKHYRMVVLRSSNRLLRPGTLLGVLVASGQNGVFEANVYSSDFDGGKLRLPKTYTMTLADDSSRLLFKKVKSKFSVNLWRLLPFMWRGSLRLRENRGEAQEGCVKVFPSPAKPTEPRYL